MDIIKNRKDWNVSKFLFDSRYTEMKKKATTKMKSTPTKCSYYCGTTQNHSFCLFNGLEYLFVNGHWKSFLYYCTLWTFTSSYIHLCVSMSTLDIDFTCYPMMLVLLFTGWQIQLRLVANCAMFFAYVYTWQWWLGSKGLVSPICIMHVPW